MRRTLSGVLVAMLILFFHGATTAQQKTCAGIAGIQCGTGQWCDLRPGSCSTSDAQGICVKVADVCTQDYRPVCGCDKRTYSNDCMRRVAKVQKDHDGACRGG
jgi:hypothetical protein